MVSIVHSFQSSIVDDPTAASAGKVLPSHWNADHELNFAATKRLLGRNTAGAGVGEEVTVSNVLDWVGSVTAGDMLYRGGSTWGLVPIGAEGYVLTSISGVPTYSAIPNALPFSDSLALIKGSSDATKLARFEIDGNTTGTTRVYTLANRDGTLADDTDLALKANLASPNFSGTPQISGVDIATKTYVDTQSNGTTKAWGRVVVTNTGGNYSLSYGHGVSVSGSAGSQKLSFSTALGSANYIVLMIASGGEGASGTAVSARSLTTTDFKTPAANGTYDFAVFGV